MRYTLALVLTLFLTPLIAQQKAVVTELSVRKGVPLNETNQLIQLEFIINAEISNFTYKLNQEKSVFTEIVDDTGFDLLKAQEEYQKSMESKGYSYNTLNLNYSGPTDDNTGIKVISNISVAPQTGAKSISIKGVVAMIMLGNEEMNFDLKNVPTRLSYGQTYATEMGEIVIQEAGSFGFDDVDFTKFYIESETPVTAVEVVGGDDSQELRDKGFAVGAYEIVFKDIPDVVNLKVTATGTTIVEIPFEMLVGVGL